jgi:hypothetical protein
MDAPTGSLIAYSNAPGAVAADGAERNGTFTKHLIIYFRIQHMKTGAFPFIVPKQFTERARWSFQTTCLNLFFFSVKDFYLSILSKRICILPTKFERR